MELTDRFERVCREIGVGHATASFCSYSQLKHTWRRAGNQITFKVSDYMDGSPEVVLDSLAWYLVCRALGRKCPSGMADAYLAYARSKDLWQRTKPAYLARARSISFEPEGEFRNLRTAFDYVISNYFRGAICDPILAWTTESPARRLGFYSEPLNLLAVNKVFDSEKVPRYALEFVIYHELLHHLDGRNGEPWCRVRHNRRFREQEERFSTFHEAEAWLKRLACKSRRAKR